MRTSRFVLALVIFVNLGLFSLSNVFPIRHVFCMGCQIGRCPLPLLVFDVCIVATEGSCLAKDEAIGMWTSMSRLEVCWRQRRLSLSMWLTEKRLVPILETKLFIVGKVAGVGWGGLEQPVAARRCNTIE
jgi:hypothetical protein